MEEKKSKYKKLVQDIKECLRFSPYCEGCKNAVPGEGGLEAKVMFVGEGPGRWEDDLGRPFVGRAGQLLDELLQKIGWERKEVYITNLIRCRPPGNRDPLPEEIAYFDDFLKREVELIRPKIIVLLGRHAVERFLPGYKITEVHGKAFRRGGCVYSPLYHPAAALRNPRFKEALENDISLLPQLLKKVEASPCSDELMYPPLKSKPTFGQKALF